MNKQVLAISIAIAAVTWFLVTTIMMALFGTEWQFINGAVGGIAGYEVATMFYKKKK